MSTYFCSLAKNIYDAFATPIEEKTIGAEDCYALAQKEIEGVNPLTLDKIQFLYKMLFSEEMKASSESRSKETYHVARLVDYLYRICLAYEEKGEIPTKDVFSIRGGTLKLRGNFEGKERTLFIFKAKKDQGYRLGLPTSGASKREQIAFLLDNKHRAGVRPTAFVELPQLGKGSAQIYERKYKPLPSLSIPLDDEKKCRLRQIAIFYARIVNQDGHDGNILANKAEIFPIDHGFSLPEGNTPPGSEMEMFAQAGKDSFTKEEALEICEAEDHSLLLEKHGLSKKAIFIYQIAHLLLKKMGQRVLMGESLSPYDLCVLRNTRKMHITPSSGFGWTRTPGECIDISRTRFQYICDADSLKEAEDRIDDSLNVIISIKKGEFVSSFDNTLLEIEKEYRK